MDLGAGLLGVSADVAPVDEEERLLAVAFRRACTCANEYAQGLVRVVVGGGVTVKPFARTTASAALSPSAVAPVAPVAAPWVNAGAVAVRVVLGLEVPPFPLGVVVVVFVEVVAVTVVLVVVLVCGAPVEVVPSGSGVLASTVFVPPPQPASSAASATPRRAMGIVGGHRLMASMIFATCSAPPGLPARLAGATQLSPRLGIRLSGLGPLTFLLATANLPRDIVSTS